MEFTVDHPVEFNLGSWSSVGVHTIFSWKTIGIQVEFILGSWSSVGVQWVHGVLMEFFVDRFQAIIPPSVSCSLKEKITWLPILYITHVKYSAHEFHK